MGCSEPPWRCTVSNRDVVSDRCAAERRRGVGSQAAKVLVRLVGRLLGFGPGTTHPDRDASKPAGDPKAIDERFCWSEAISVGLGGLERPASSLSAITRLPLCNPAFLQVVRDRRG